jgi:hypothetical protein
VVDEDVEEDKDEDDGKEPRTIGQGEMVNSWADNVDTVVDNQLTVLHEQGQEMRGHTPRPQPLACVPWPQTTDPRPRPRNPETYPLSGLEHLGLLTLQTPRPVVPTLRETEAAGNTSDVDVDQQRLIEPAGGNRFPDVLLPDVSPPDVPLPDVALPEVAHPEAHPDDSVG